MGLTTDPKVSKLEKVLVPLLAVVYGLAVWMQAFLSGAIGVARNDDWVYLHMTYWFAEDGIFRVESASLTNALGQVILGWPIARIFGRELAAFQLETLVIAVIGLVVTYVLLRTFLGIKFSLFSALILAVSPIWLVSVTSFMTDIPAYTFQVSALLALVCAIRSSRHRFSLFALALILSLWAFSIREFAIVSTITVLVAFGWSLVAKKKVGSRKSDIWIFILMAISVISVAALLYDWRAHLPNSQVRSFAFTVEELKWSFVQLFQGLITVSVIISPATILVGFRRIFRHMHLWGYAILAIFSALVTVSSVKISNNYGLLLGNIFSKTGPYAETLPGTGQVIFSPTLVNVLSVIGVVSSIFVTVVVAQRVRFLFPRNLVRVLREGPNGSNIVALFVFGSGAALFLIAAVTNSVLFDRYLLVFLALGAGLLLSVTSGASSSRVNIPFAVVALVFLGLLGFYTSSFSATFDGLKWKIGTELTSLGIPAETIDAGYEWFGYHQSDVATVAYLRPVDNWWTTFYKDPSVCVRIFRSGTEPVEFAKAEPLITESSLSFLGRSVTLTAYAAPQSCLTGK